jgi:hypothetical protein
VRRTTVLAFAALAACTDVHGFQGTWSTTGATLTIDRVDSHSIAGAITFAGGPVSSPLRESVALQADALSTMTFAGSPLHVYLAYFDMQDNCGEALAVISLYENHRVELRVLRGMSTCRQEEVFGAYSLVEVGP